MNKEFANFKHTRDKLEALHSLHPNSPTRLPDWRVRLVQYAIGRGSLKGLRLDAIAKRYYKYELAKQQANTNPDLLLTTFHRFWEKDRALSEAIAIGENLLNPNLALNLQCFTLAKAPVEYIVANFNISSQGYQYYLALYFDILDRIDSLSYILNFAIFQDGNFDLTVHSNRARFLSYFGGLEAAKYCCYRTAPNLFTYSDGKPTEATTKELLTLASHNIAERIYALTSSNTDFDASELATLYKTLKESANKSATSSEASDTTQELLKLVQWNLKLRDDATSVQQDISQSKALTEQVYNRDEC